MRTTPCNDRRRRDPGSILPMVLVVVVVLSMVVVGVATYAATDLRYGQVVEARAGRIAAAQGALDDTLEKLSLKNPICSTAGTAGIDIPFPEVVNGATVVTNCKVVGTTLPAFEGWAVVVTGEGAPANSDPVFQLDNSSQVDIKGPVYLQLPNRTDLKKTTMIVEGDLWHPDDPCAETNPADTGIQYASSTLTIPKLQFSAGRGVYCINRTWSELFGTGPTVSADIATLPLNPAYASNGTCRVFSPGRYDNAGALPLSSSNYFKSGVYVFDNVGLISLHGKSMTMGQIVQQGYPAISNTACDAARIADATTGATLYTRGNTRFESRANSGLEISGRLQGKTSVALHVLDTSIGYSTPLITSDNGNHKEMAFQGMVWAPYSSLVFDTVPSDKAAMLRGGAVIASFQGKVAASASGFLIEVATSEANARLVLEATATDSRGSSIVRAVVDYRPSSGEVAVNSRRVVK